MNEEPERKASDRSKLDMPCITHTIYLLLGHWHGASCWHPLVVPIALTSWGGGGGGSIFPETRTPKPHQLFNKQKFLSAQRTPSAGLLDPLDRELASVQGTDFH